MVKLICDRCDKPFEVPDDRLGSKVPCPSCGDINIAMGTAANSGGGGVRGGGGGGGGEGGGVARPAGSERAAALGLPPADGPEKTVIEIRGAMFRSRPFSFLALMLVLGGSLVAAPILAIQTAGIGSIAALGVALAALVVLGVWKIASLSERLTITTKRVIQTRGLLSKSTIEMLHRTIQDVEIEQAFVDRLWGVGKLSISNAGQEDDEIVIHHAPKPYQIRDMIDAYRPM